jgi:tetratricopeptide (TPR) repeat protein
MKSATPEALVNAAAQYYRQGRYVDCLSTAKKALELRPDYPEAYNNLAAAYLSMKMWDEGIAAARKALELKPGYADAKDNLDYALAHRPKNVRDGQ